MYVHNLRTGGWIGPIGILASLLLSMCDQLAHVQACVWATAFVAGRDVLRAAVVQVGAGHGTRLVTRQQLALEIFRLCEWHSALAFRTFYYLFNGGLRFHIQTFLLLNLMIIYFIISL